MKRLFTIVALLISTELVTNAQTSEYEYGRIKQEDVDMVSYNKDKSAEAVVIYDVGSSNFVESDGSYEVVYERATRIKILKEAGLKWADVEIPFYREGDIFERVYDLEACTYNYENGVLLKTVLDIADCKDEKINVYWTNHKFAMPNVKEGSIIEFRYKLSSEFLFQFRDWEFQWKIPVIYSKYQVGMIPFYQYSWLLQGATKFDSQKSYESTGFERTYGTVKFKDMIYEFVMRDVPAFKDEEYLSSINDYIIKLDFQLSKVIRLNGSVENIQTTWPEMIKDFMKADNFSKYAVKCEKLAPKVLNMAGLLAKSPHEKFDSIMNYVKNNFKWDGMLGKYATKSPKEFLNDKQGNDADLNLFAIGLLNAAGVKATPLLVSTRQNGKIKFDYPFNHFFNYVLILAEFDGKKILADVTDPLKLNDRIPERCINDKGLIIQKDNVEWINTQTVASSKVQKKILLTLDGLTQNATIETSATEYDALDYRKDYGDDKTIIHKRLVDKGYNLSDTSIVVKNSNNIIQPYVFRYAVKSKPEIVNDKIYISPFLNETMTENPLKQQERTYPIDMIYPTRRNFYADIRIPDGYKVDFLPENDKIQNDQFELEYTIGKDENKLLVSFIYSFKQPVYSSTEYLKIKYYFNEIIKKGTDKIVLARE